ncbi:MAG: hypothetical protein HN793_04310 [Rhodospirillaceae bacterium]|jgi:hypothetical protein|nr:hypothetical protein [Rhodospirillaceae bacterium]MBT5240742.1 hypothetical protein [Rhodospirillaceae bacterium]MBT5564068.1 hypothetical protein [Rhodospirillaceae bacterium]MBT6091042.1 hypothetical protein [Rhodospirillaceae bacterium]MBT6961119.1 hypothetical protein [Rhodospirillaceae bacterium]
MSGPSSPQNVTPGEPSKAFVRAVTRLMRPLIRALIGQGMTFPYLSNLLKAVYVDVARTDFPVDESEPSVSRLSVLTGLQRKDVNRILYSPPPDRTPPQSVSLSARLVGIWTGDPRFIDGEGAPKALPRTAEDPDVASFDSLMRAVSTDVRAKVILDEWVRLAVVSIDDAGMVTLNQGAFVPSRGFDEKAYYLGRNVADHMATSVHNLLGDGEPLFERAVYYDRLTPKSIELLRERARDVGMQALLELNKDALALADKDEGDAEATERMSLGLYYYDGPDEKLAGGPDADDQRDDSDDSESGKTGGQV